MQLEKLLSSVDMKPEVDRVDDQLNWGSCQSHASASALELVWHRAGNPTDFSRMFLYYWFQKMAGTFGTDGGGHPDDLAQILNDHGCALEDDWPYDSDHIWYTPTDAVNASARSLIPQGSVATVGLGVNKTAIKRALNQGSPVIFVVNDSDTFHAVTGNDWRTHSWDVGNFISQHVVLCIGYDDAAGRWLCQNSWGPNWGDGGFFGLPYDQKGFLSSAMAFTKLPVPLHPLTGYIPYGIPTFNSITGILEVPQIAWIQSPFSGAKMYKNARIRIVSSAGDATPNSPKFNAGFGTNYIVFQNMAGQSEMGFPQLIFDGVLYKNVHATNPNLELISAEFE